MEKTSVLYHHEDRGSKVIEFFCKFKVNGHNGRGLGDFCFRLVFFTFLIIDFQSFFFKFGQKLDLA